MAMVRVRVAIALAFAARVSGTLRAHALSRKAAGAVDIEATF